MLSVPRSVPFVREQVQGITVTLCAQVPWHGALCPYSPMDTHRHPCVFWCLRVPVRAPLYDLHSETCLSTCPSTRVPGHPLKVDMGCMIQDTGRGNQASLGHTGPGRLFLSPLDQHPEDANACAYLHLYLVCVCVQTLLCIRVSGVCLYACEPELLLPQGPWPAPPQGSTLHKQHEVLGRLNIEAGRSQLLAWCRWVGVCHGAGSRGGHEPGELGSGE